MYDETPVEAGLLPPLAGGMQVAEVAAQTGRTLKSVYCRRVVLGVPDGRTASGRTDG